MIFLEVQSLSTILTISIIAFLAVILLLVAVLLYAKAKLLPEGNVKLSINTDNVYEVPAGVTLLSTLQSKKIFLPSACGGGGTCGLCECEILEGGGQILPTEVPHFTRSEIKHHKRLACQVKVKEDMIIEIAPEVMGVKKWECEVISNKNVATYIKEFVVKLPENESLDFRSGGYIQIDVPKITVQFKEFDIEKEFHEDWDKYKMWDLVMKNTEETFRAYSMANHPAEGNIIMLNIRIATPPWDKEKNRFLNVNSGICSSYLFSRKPGDKVMISGPYGEFFIKDTKNEMMFIGGGAGMAPMRSHIFDLFNTKKTDRKATFWYGARSLREVFYEEDFNKIAKENANFEWNLALSEPLPNDNWTGPTGFIHQVIYDKYLEYHEEPESIDYYLCGPPMMNTAVQKMLSDLGVPDENVMFDDFGE